MSLAASVMIRTGKRAVPGALGSWVATHPALKGGAISFRLLRRAGAKRREHREREIAVSRPNPPTYGFWVGRISTSLMKDCGSWVTSIATACATSSG